MDILYGIVKAMWVVWMKLTGIYKKKKKNTVYCNTVFAGYALFFIFFNKEWGDKYLWWQY